MQVLSKVCGKCGKAIEATTQSQLDWNFKLHTDKHQREAAKKA